MSSTLRLLALVASVTVPTALSLPAAAAGYFDTPDAPLVPPTEYDTGSAAASTARQHRSGYFGDAGAPLVAPTANDH